MCHLFFQFPDLRMRRALACDYLRATTLTKEGIQRFFDIVSEGYTMCKTISNQDLLPKNIWAMDEVGFCLAANGGYKIIARKGAKRVYVMAGSSRQHITVVFCCNARGYCLEPAFIVPSRYANNFTIACRDAGFPNPLVLSSERAYMDFSCFGEWTDFYIKNTKHSAEESSMLVYNGHTTHTLNLEALKILTKIR